MGRERHRADSLPPRPAKIDYLVAHHAEIDQTGVEAPMLHWLDAYVAGDAVPFSNDAFGQHYAREQMFNELVGQ